MAGVIDKLRKKNDKKSSADEWSKTGTLMKKPTRGWLHPDEQLAPSIGVCYGVRYVGCMKVKMSMRSLDFDTRTMVAKESISRVCDAAGLKTASKKKRVDKKITKLLADMPNMQYAGSNTNLTITTDSLSLVIMETGDVIANHQMPGISFASGGDPDTMDFVAYVAKDPVNNRACHVLECGGGLAQDVITTIGQAFELRFKEFLRNQPRVTNFPDRLDNPNMFTGGDSWGEEVDYYNDQPGKRPPSPSDQPPQYSTPNNLLVSDGNYASVKYKDMGPVYDNKEGLLVDLSDSFHGEEQGAVGGIPAKGIELLYDNQNTVNESNEWESRFDDAIYDNKSADKPLEITESAPNGHLDAFDMEPFNSNLPPAAGPDGGNSLNSGSPVSDRKPYHEEWFHGSLTRKQTEELLKKDGDFLVRESANSPGQYVLSGMKKGKIKHLLLVDPEGVVRTKDRTFDSVSHLISYHLDNSLPIVSQESELLLIRPVMCTEC